MVWDSNTKVYDELNANEKERAMGFLTRTTTTYDLIEGQQLFILSQAMDLNSLIWFIGRCLAIQSNGGHLLTLKAKSNDQGAKQITHSIEVEEFEQFLQLKYLAIEEVRAHRIFASLA